MSAPASLSTTPSTGKPPRRDSRLWLGPRALIALFAVWLLSRWVFAALRQLVPDEAYYWTWSRHLALSYFDHPPVIAYLIRSGTALFGTTELGVRWLAGVMTAATVLILTLITRRIVDHSKAAAFVPVALLLSPMIAAIGVIATPDTPACFFQSAALACALLIFAPSRSNQSAALFSSLTRRYGWLLFGFCMGLALDSKYTSVLLGIAVLLALLSCREGRSHLLAPWPWLGAAIAAALFFPVILWNSRHQWASFRFQLHHGLGAGASPAWENLLAYLGGQLVVCTPVLFVLCLIVLFVYARRRGNPMHIRILLLAGITPLLFFAYSSLHKRVEGNWPMFAYLPTFILVAHYLAERWDSRRVAWAALAVQVAFLATILVHAPELTWKISGGRLSVPQWDEMFGWRQLAVDVDSLRLDPAGGKSPVFTANYEYASELEFYLPGHPDVWPLPDPTRPTTFDFTPGYVPPGSFDRLVLVRRLSRGYEPPAVWKPFGASFRYSFPTDPSEYQDGRQLRRTLIEIATKIKG